MAKLADDRYASFLEKVFELTKSCTLSWHYLDSSQTLCEGMKWSKTYSGVGALVLSDNVSFSFNTEKSFYCSTGGTYIVLLVKGTQPANVYVVPSTFKNTVYLSAEIYGDIITRLLNLVQSQFPDGEVFIDKFLKE